MLPDANIMLSLDSIGLLFIDGLYKGIEEKSELVEYVHKKLTDNKHFIIHNEKEVKGEEMRNALNQIEEKLRKTFFPLLQETGGIRDFSLS